MAIWIATALGLAGGVVLAYAAGRTILPRMVARSQDMYLAVRMALAGAIVALLPAFFLSIVVGGTLGGAWGEQVFRQIGVPSSGVPSGLAIGIALVFAAVLIVGTGMGLLLAKAVIVYRQRRFRI